MLIEHMSRDRRGPTKSSKIYKSPEFLTKFI